MNPPRFREWLVFLVFILLTGQQSFAQQTAGKAGNEATTLALNEDISRAFGVGSLSIPDRIKFFQGLVTEKVDRDLRERGMRVAEMNAETNTRMTQIGEGLIVKVKELNDEMGCLSTGLIVLLTRMQTQIDASDAGVKETRNLAKAMREQVVTTDRQSSVLLLAGWVLGIGLALGGAGIGAGLYLGLKRIGS